MIHASAQTLALAVALTMAVTLPASAQKGPSQPTTAPADASLIEGVLLDAMSDEGGDTASLRTVRVHVDARITDPAVDEDLRTRTPEFIIEADGEEVLRFDGEPFFFDFLPVTVRVVDLDPSSPEPEVIATSYTGGAHCCDRIQVASVQPDGIWTMQELGLFDGGYVLSDANNDGLGEIEVRDQSFLYTFDCYACSWAPPRFFTLENGVLNDISQQPSFADAYAQAIGDYDPAAHIDEPGSLAGWAALEARLGRGEEALRTIEQIGGGATYNYEACTTGGSVWDCPPKALRDLTFAEYLREHLDNEGYLEAGQ